MSSQSNASTMLFGALVADAASLGVHWIYTPEKLPEIAKQNGGSTAFVPADPANYEGIKGYFAHGARPLGALTQYGEVLRLSIGSILADGSFDVGSYQTRFAAHFGPGGAYQGYIDRPTRGTLDNIAGEILSPSGIDDDQLPATATLPAVLARYRGGAQEHVRAAQRVTNVNDLAALYGDLFTGLIESIFEGAALEAALKDAAQSADPEIQGSLLEALETSETDSSVYAAVNGRACHLPMAAPLIFHILKHSESFAEAVERNNLSGGDNAGRSILIGALMGLVHGHDPKRGIPLRWALRLKDGAEIWDDCVALSKLS